MEKSTRIYSSEVVAVIAGPFAQELNGSTHIVAFPCAPEMLTTSKHTT